MRSSHQLGAPAGLWSADLQVRIILTRGPGDLRFASLSRQRSGTVKLNDIPGAAYAYGA
jgi:hypothetical protein